MDVWKKRNRLTKDRKIFIIKGGYDDIREALISRGWFENPDNESPCFDFLFCVKTSDVDFENLERHQKVNHFNFPGPLSSKSGLCRNLRNMIWEEKVDVDEFYPRCYDLRDFSDFHNFIEDFKFTKAQAILNTFLKSPETFKLSKERIDLVFDICHLRIRSVQSFLDDTVNFSSYQVQ